MQRWRLAVAWGCIAAMAVALVVVLAGMRDGARTPAAPSGPDVAAVASPEPVSSPSAEPTPPGLVLDRGERPEVDLTGEDFDRIVRDLVRLSYWLARNPDPDLAHLVWYPNGPAHAFYHRQLTEAHENGWRHASPDLRILEIEVLDRPEPDIVIVRVVEESGTDYVVNEQEEIVVERPAYGPAATIHVLRREASGEWKLFKITPE